MAQQTERVACFIFVYDHIHLFSSKHLLDDRLHPPPSTPLDVEYMPSSLIASTSALQLDVKMQMSNT